MGLDGAATLVVDEFFKLFYGVEFINFVAVVYFLEVGLDVAAVAQKADSGKVEQNEQIEVLTLAKLLAVGMIDLHDPLDRGELVAAQQLQFPHLAQPSRQVLPHLLPHLHLTLYQLLKLRGRLLQSEHLLAFHRVDLNIFAGDVVPEVGGEAMAVEALKQGEAEPGLVLGQLAQYLRVGLEQHHFEEEHREQNAGVVTEKCGDDLELALDVAGDEVFEVGVGRPAEAVTLRAPQLVLGFEADQNDVLLLVLNLA